MLEFLLGYSAGSNTASRAASLARSAAASDLSVHSNRVEDLNERIDELALVLRGMWALLEEQGFTNDRLLAKLEELDHSDGTPDGRVKKEPSTCPACEAKVPPGLARCQYCGADVPVDNHPLGQI
jgi:hypothetical protein